MSKIDSLMNLSIFRNISLKSGINYKYYWQLDKTLVSRIDKNKSYYMLSILNLYNDNTFDQCYWNKILYCMKNSLLSLNMQNNFKDIDYMLPPQYRIQCRIEYMLSLKDKLDKEQGMTGMLLDLNNMLFYKKYI